MKKTYMEPAMEGFKMKKTYIEPAMEAIEMNQMGSLLASSMDVPGTTDVTEGNLARELGLEFEWDF